MINNDVKDIHIGMNKQTYIDPAGSHAGREKKAVVLTRYSKTSVRDLSVWMISCSVTMLACLRSFSSDTIKRRQV